ncbi:MAG: thioredoxin family protein [Deltaproteobacteria bacterium]|nr:thioredoxin family protein [Deltaproteobacteria bacterium]
MILAPSRTLVGLAITCALSAPWVVGCGATSERSTHASESTVAARPADVVGVTSREAIEAAVPAWHDAIAAADPEDETARALAGVPAGAEVDVFLGTWCGDSRREISRLFLALEIAAQVAPLPFTIRFVGVDRSKVAPGLSEDADLRYVPTVIVRRDGVEQGRIVETATRGIEQDLLDLLTGTRSGFLSLTRTP